MTLPGSPTADRFAAYNGTAPDRVVLGEPEAADPPAVATREPHHEPRAPHRRGHPDSATPTVPAAAFYDRKRAEGQTTKTAIRALKRRISNVVYRHLIADAATRHDADEAGPGGQPGTTLQLQRGRLNPEHRHFGDSHSRTRPTRYAHNPPLSTGPPHAPATPPNTS